MLPRGYTVDDLKWDWIPAGMPWWNPKDEIAGDVLAIQNKLRTRSEIRRERYGDDWRDVVRQLAQEERFLEEMGMSAATTEQPPGPAPSMEPEEEADEPEDEDEDNGEEDNGDDASSS